MSKDDEMLEELRRIRTALEPKPAPAAPAPKGVWGEFMDFISKYRVLGLAVGFIMGLYLGNLVQALVKDLIMPVIGLAIPGVGNLATYTIELLSQDFRKQFYTNWQDLVLLLVLLRVKVLVMIVRLWLPSK